MTAFADTGVSPVLRWAGGKRWLALGINSVAQDLRPGTYVEPFVGGAAVFLRTKWPAAVLSDANESLMLCYKGISSSPAAVRSVLSELSVNVAQYEQVARWRTIDPIRAAARLLYLNRLAYGGIYRVNRAGEYNVPYSGDRSMDSLIAPGRLESLAERFVNATLVSGDFEETLRKAPAGSLIFSDPPYSVSSGETTFRRYQAQPFTWEDQERLARALKRCVNQGSTVLLANCTHQLVRDLYPKSWVAEFPRRSSFGRNPVRTESVYVLDRCPDRAAKVGSMLKDGVARG